MDGVFGIDKVKGHALTLNLLGAGLRDAHAGDIRKRDQLILAAATSAVDGATTEPRIRH